MKIEVSGDKKEFKPFTVSITFETEYDLRGTGSFMNRFERCKKSKGINYMSMDSFCVDIHRAIERYAPKE